MTDVRAGECVSLPDSSLIIASRNRPTLLIETVESILRGNALPTELIIVDQSHAPNEALASRLSTSQCHIRYTWTRDVGLSHANNVGIAAAIHDVLVFTHDDVEVDPGWFRVLVGALCAHGPGAIVTGRVLPGHAETTGGFVPTLKTDDQPAVYAGRIDNDQLYPLNMAMYRSAIATVGPFDTRLGPGTSYPAGEDNDLGFRLLEAGYRLIYVPGAIVFHRAWRNDFLRLRWSYGRGQGAYFAKHLSLRDRFMLRRLRSYLMRQARNFVQNIGHDNRRSMGNLISMVAVLSAVAQWLLTEKRAGR